MAKLNATQINGLLSVTGNILSGGGGALKVLFDIMHPVNSLYITVGSEDPNSLFSGQTWEKLQGGYALTTTNNTSGGDASTANAINHMPGQAFQGGLPNITGEFYQKFGTELGGFFDTYNDAKTGCFARGSSKTKAHAWQNFADSYSLLFDASRSSDRYGMYQTTRKSVVADHIAVVVWKRTA